MDASLHRAYKMHSDGKLSAEAFLSVFDGAESILTEMLDNLNDMRHPSKPTIDRINSMLYWIESVRSGIQSG